MTAVVHGVHMQALMALTDSDAVSEIGSENLVDNTELTFCGPAHI